MKLLNIIVVIFISFSSLAQLLPIQFDTNRVNTEIILNGYGDYAGNSIEKAITGKFLFSGGYIDDDIKQRSFDRHRAINRLGVDVSAEADYRAYNVNLFKSNKWGIVVKAGYSAFGGVIYSKDFFGLAMYGNAMYLGDTIDMSGMDASLTTFQKIGFGCISQISKSSVVFNIYNINQRFKANFRDFSLIQSEAGDQMILEMDGVVSAPQNKSFTQGLGFGLDFDFKIPISWKEDETAFLQFQAKNVGVGFMIEEQVNYSMDTLINYDGFTFEEIMGSSSVLSDSIDFLDTLGIRKTTNKPVFLLPGFVQVAKIVDDLSDRKLQSFYGFRVYPTLIYSPLIYAGLDYKPTDWVRLGAQLSYGGFAGFRAGFYSSFSFSNYNVGLGSENLLGFFTDKASGQSLILRLRCAF